MPCLYHPWADTNEENSIFGKLGMELCHHHIQAGFVDSIRPTGFDLILCDQIKVGMPRRDGNDLLLLALEEKW